MDSLTKIPTKYARLSRDDRRILCANTRCNFCFGELARVTGDLEGYVVWLDGGFVPIADRPVPPDLVTLRKAQYRADICTAFVLSTTATEAYRHAKATKRAGSFRAPARHGSVLGRHTGIDGIILSNDALISCPEHGRQVISLERLGARSGEPQPGELPESRWPKSGV